MADDLGNTDEGVITEIKRLANSHLGNPAYQVTLDNGNRYRTKANSSVAFEISNSAYQGCTVRLLLTKALTIWDISVI